MTLAAALGISEGLADRIYNRIVEKLEREPVEDFRLDYEDGYGNRPDAEEDGHARSAARELASAVAAGSAPPFVGIRIKPLTDELRERSIRTLDLFISTLLDATGARVPVNFVVTLPKITSPGQPRTLADLFDAKERAAGLAPGSLRMELMVETPQSIFDERGNGALPALVDAGRGRIVAAHFGTYDYTASLGITAAYQHMRHPACDFARHVMQVSLAGTGVWLSDGATNVLPVPLHRARGAETLTDAQLAQNRDAIHRAWKLHYGDVR